MLLDSVGSKATDKAPSRYIDLASIIEAPTGSVRALVASDLGRRPFWSWSRPFSGDLGGHGQLLPFA